MGERYRALQSIVEDANPTNQRNAQQCDPEYLPSGELSGASSDAAGSCVVVVLLGVAKSYDGVFTLQAQDFPLGWHVVHAQITFCGIGIVHISTCRGRNKVRPRKGGNLPT